VRVDYLTIAVATNPLARTLAKIC